MVYILDHYYAVDHADYCLVVESDKSVNEIVEICSSIAFLLEDLVDDSASLDMSCLLKVLETYYGAKNIKPNVSKRTLNMLGMPIDDVYKKTTIAVNHTDESYPDRESISDEWGYIVDLYEARESCCGEKYKQVMKRNLPKGEDLEDLRILLRLEGAEE